MGNPVQNKYAEKDDNIYFTVFLLTQIFPSLYSPWGEVVSTTDERESIVYADIDLDFLESVRK